MEAIQAYESSREKTITFEEVGLRKLGRADVLSIHVNYSYPYLRIIECKAKRADLLRDLREQKWKRYTKIARHVLFAFPVGLAEVSEIPEDVGILLIDENRSVRPVRLGKRYEALPNLTILLSIIFNKLRDDRHQEFRTLKKNVTCPNCHSHDIVIYEHLVICTPCDRTYELVLEGKK